MQHRPAKHEKHDDPHPKNPLVLLRPPLNHPDRVPRNPQRVPHRIQPPLRRLQYLPLLPQVPQYRLPAREVLVQRRVRARKELLLPQGVRLPADIPAPQSSTCPGLGDARRPRMPPSR